MSMNPTDLLAERHKPYRQAREHYPRATAARAAAQERVAQLDSELAAAESRDRITRGDALVDGRRLSKSEADSVRPRLEEAKRDAEDLAYAEQRAASALGRLPVERKREWLSAATRSLQKAKAEHLAAIGELVRTREQLDDESVLVSFLANEGTYTQPIGAGIQRRMGDGTIQRVDFAQLIESLRTEAGDAEQKALLDPNRPMPELQPHLARGGGSKSWS